MADMKQRRRCCTPLPVPPPQGGRERCGTAFAPIKGSIRVHVRRCEHALALSRGRTECASRPGKSKPTRRVALAKRNQVLSACCRALCLADLAQDLGGVLAEPWRGAR